MVSLVLYCSLIISLLFFEVIALENISEEYALLCIHYVKFTKISSPTELLFSFHLFMFPERDLRSTLISLMPASVEHKVSYSTA
jgi:hypothetical protein